MTLRSGWILLALGCAAATPRASAAQQPRDTSLAASYRATAARLIAAATADTAAWLRLAELTDTFGPRISGSRSLEDALDWVLAQMAGDGLENVHGEPAMVPHWVRGRESLELLEPRRTPLPMLGLGRSVGTPAGGITAPVLVVSDTLELRARAAEARGKIVLFDAPYVSYGQTVAYRWNGAVWAAQAGAVAALLRSVSPFEMRQPHTGVTHYDSTACVLPVAGGASAGAGSGCQPVRPIPFAAISIEDAAMLHRMQGRGQRVVVTLRMDARMLPDVPSRNVVAELKGAERPDEVVVLSGHLDSWDVGTGAMDDAGGFVAAWQALLVMKRLGLRPRRTVRLVGWTNEEYGTRGGLAYRDAHAGELARHDVAIESDGGVFRPVGFGFTGSDSAFAVVRAVGPLLAAIGADTISRGGGGTDIEPIMDRGVPGMSLNDDGRRYFWYHHSDADTVDKLDPRDVAKCVAAMAVMGYVLADLPEPLPRGPVPGAAGE
ncbi:MAG TPA: M20/M25/M40 family metallo-hydrolase [Gemmatimonadales bacterium]|nr:M20/M25/M40 family metallo-hydrolase [Gemmatimonadales bacterium]